MKEKHNRWHPLWPFYIVVTNMRLMGETVVSRNLLWMDSQFCSGFSFQKYAPGSMFYNNNNNRNFLFPFSLFWHCSWWMLGPFTIEEWIILSVHNQEQNNAHETLFDGIMSSMNNVRTCQKMTEVVCSSTHVKIKPPKIMGTVATACHMAPSLPLVPDILPTPPFNQKLHMYRLHNEYHLLSFSLLMHPLLS